MIAHRPRRTIAALTLASLGAVSASSGADSSSSVAVRVLIDPAVACTDAGAFLSEIRARTLRAVPAGPSDAALEFRVSTTVSSEGVQGLLEVIDPAGGKGDRRVGGASCEEVVSALVLIAAIVVDPRVLSAPANSGSPTASTARPAPPAPSAPPSAAPSAWQVPPPPAPKRVDFGVGATLSVESGIGPGAAVAPGLFGLAAFPSAPARPTLRVGVGWGLSRSVDTSLGTASFSLTRLRLEPCLVPLRGNVAALQGCAWGSVTWLTGHGENTREPATKTRQVWTLGLSLRPRLEFGRFLLELGFGAGRTVSTFEYYFTPGATAYEVPRWAGFGEFSAGVLFL